MPETPRRRSRLPIVLTVVGAIVLGLGAVGALAWCSTFGCTVLSEDFEPHGEEAVRARAEATAALAEAGASLAKGHPVLAATTLDDCLAGQHNWKVRDTYSHECFVRDSRVLELAATDAEVGPALTDFDATVRGRGCEASPGGGLDAVRTQYWSPTNPNVVREGAAGLPRAAYDCPDGSRVEARPTGADTRDTDPAAALGPDLAGNDVLSGDRYDAADLASVRASRASLALVVTVSRPYYRTRF
ncbi:hypothetical protein [Phycicoccus duodecadis]|uniref:Uncharacterized protein n=1 Tax=Phycicoccus duodecadis TaxID=173053 RepID=A0A2N3YGM1_9MICO|nr:hypothetical protein [Phycicoccus duodecadis]PKW25988.1 hypothetical protein ATL31_0792 [Phycicoccus duodecadis]